MAEVLPNSIYTLDGKIEGTFTDVCVYSLFLTIGLYFVIITDYQYILVFMKYNYP